MRYYRNFLVLNIVSIRRSFHEYFIILPVKKDAMFKLDTYEQDWIIDRPSLYTHRFPK